MAVVSTRHAGIPEAVKDGVTGLLVGEGDTEKMAKAFLQVVSSAADLGNAGYQEAVSKHAWHCEKSRLMGWLDD